MVAFLINTLTAALTSSMLTGHGLMATPRMRSAPPMAISSPFTFDGRSSTETASPYDMGGYGRCASIGISNPRPCSHPSPNMCALPVSLFPLADEHGGMRGMNEMGGMGGYGRMAHGHGGGMYGGMGGRMGGHMGGHMGMSEHQLAMGARREGRARMGGYDE